VGCISTLEEIVKKHLRELLDTRRIEEIVDLAARQRHVLGALLSLTYDAEPLIAWRAVEAMGAAAARIADDDPEYVREHLRRLRWLISDESGGICWHAPEAMAEIVRRRPAMFPDYIPVVVYLLRVMEKEDLVHFRAGIFWAIGRLGDIAASEIDVVLPSIAACLDDSDPQVRGMAVWCLAQFRRTEPLQTRSHLLSDEGTVELYVDGHLARPSVAELMRQALA
jgi:hypothetical protein